MKNTIHSFRLSPGADLRLALAEFCEAHRVEAGVLLSCVGSLSKVALRFAGKESATIIERSLEIVSVTGTLSRNGMHIHLAVSDEEGKVIGGHLSETALVRTTCEVVIQEIEGIQFRREHDAQTGYKELSIHPDYR